MPKILPPRTTVSVTTPLSPSVTNAMTSLSTFFGIFATTRIFNLEIILSDSLSSIARSKFSTFEAFIIFSRRIFSISSSFPFKKLITFLSSSAYSSFVTRPVQGARQSPIEKLRHSLFKRLVDENFLVQVRILNADDIVLIIAFGSMPEMYGPKYLAPSFFTFRTISRRGNSSFRSILMYGKVLPSLRRML